MPRGVPRDLEGRRERRLQDAARSGERIRFYRLLRRKTMQELGDEAGCSLHTIWRAETGRNKLRFNTEQRVAQALGVDSWDISYNPLPETPEEATARRPNHRQVPDLNFSEEEFTEEELREGQELVDGYIVHRPRRKHKERRKKQRPAGRVRGRKNKKRKKKG